MSQPDVPADHTMIADLRCSPEYRCVGIDHDMVSDIRMTLAALDRISVFVQLKALGADGHALIQLDMIAEHSSFTHNDTCSMVYAEMMADDCTGVNINACFFMCIFCHDSRNERYVQLIQFMCDPVNGYRIESGIADNDFALCLCGRIPVINCLYIRQQKTLDLRQTEQELFSQFFRITCLIVQNLKTDADLLFQPAGKCFQAFLRRHFQITEKLREHNDLCRF